MDEPHRGLARVMLAGPETALQMAAGSGAAGLVKGGVAKAAFFELGTVGGGQAGEYLNYGQLSAGRAAFDAALGLPGSILKGVSGFSRGARLPSRGEGLVLTLGEEPVLIGSGYETRVYRIGRYVVRVPKKFASQTVQDFHRQSIERARASGLLELGQEVEVPSKEGPLRGFLDYYREGGTWKQRPPTPAEVLSLQERLRRAAKLGYAPRDPHGGNVVGSWVVDYDGMFMGSPVEALEKAKGYLHGACTYVRVPCPPW